MEEHKLSAEELKEVLPATESWPMDFSQAHVLIKYLLDNHSENAPEIRHACDNTITARIIDLIADNKLDKIKTLKEHFNLGDQKWGDLLPHNFSQIAYFIASTLKTGKPYIYPLLDKAQQAYEQDPNSTDSVHSLDQLVAEAFTGNKALANLLNCITVTPNNFDSILSSQPINVLFASGAMKTLADHFKIGTSIEASSYDFAFYVAMSNYIKILLENRRTADIQQLVAEFTPNLENLTHIQVCFNQLSGFFWSTLKNHGTLPLTFYQYVFFSAQDVCGFIHETATTPDERYRVQHGLLHSGILAYALSDKSNLNSSDKDDILTDWQLTLKTYISTEALERSVEDVVQLIQQVKALHPLKFKTEVELFTPEVLTATDYAKQLTQHYIEALLTQKQWGTLGELAKYDSLTTSNLTTIISNYLKDQATNTENWGWINIAIIELTKHDHIDESFIMDHVCQTVVDEVNKNHNDYHGFPLLETLGIDQDIVDSAVTKLQEALATGDYDACYKAFKIANQSREARKLLCNHFLEMTSLKQLSDIKDLSDFKEKLKTPHNKLIALKDSEFFTYLQGSHPSIMTLIDAFEDNAELWEKLIEASSALEAETDKEENGSPVYLHDFIIPRDLTDNKYWYIPQAVAKKIGDDIAQIPYSILERPFYNSFVGVDKALENDTHSLEFLSDDGLTYELQTASSSNLVLLLTGASSHARSTTPPSLTGTSPARFPTTPSFTGTSPARFSETPPSPMRVDTPPQQQPAASPVSQMSLSTGDSSSGSEANATPTPPSPGFNVSFFSERSGEDYPFPTKPGQFNSKAFDSQINLLAHWVNLALIAVNDHSDISSYMENPPLKEQLINVATNNTKLKKCYTLSFDALAQEAESSWKIGARELTDKAIARLLGFDPTAADLVIKTDPKGKQRDIKFQEAVTATINLKALLASIRYQDPTITALWLQLIVTTHCALIPKASKTHEKNLDRFQKKLQAAFTTGDLKGILQAGVAPHEIENAKAILQKALPVQEKRHGITTNRDGTQKFPATIDALLERYSRALTKSEKFGLKTRLRVEHPQSDTSRYAARRRASQRASGSSLITTGKQEPAAPLPPAQKTVSILTSENPTNIWSAANIEIDDFNFDARSEIF